MSWFRFLCCGKPATANEVGEIRDSKISNIAEVRKSQDKGAESSNELENEEPEKKYSEILNEVIRPRTSTDNKSLTKPEPRRKTGGSARATIVEEPLLENLCELSEIEPNHLLYDTMTVAERRNLVEKFSENPNTASIFENKAALNDFVTGRGNSVYCNGPRISRQVSISSVSSNMVGRRAGSDIRWEKIRSSIRESKKNKSKIMQNKVPPRKSDDAVFKDLIEDIVTHRESEMQRKRISGNVSNINVNYNIKNQTLTEEDEEDDY